jgi:hypothetical protein
LGKLIEKQLPLSSNGQPLSTYTGEDLNSRNEKPKHYEKISVPSYLLLEIASRRPRALHPPHPGLAVSWTGPNNPAKPTKRKPLAGKFFSVSGKRHVLSRNTW